MAKRLLFIINPHSGRGSIKTKLLEIVDIFIKGGYEVLLHITQGPEDAFKMAKTYGKNFNTIVASGGDGTLNEVIRGIMTIPKEKRPKIGYLPSGTVNDFASSMRISKNVLKAAKNVTNGTPFKLDIGRFNQNDFVYVAAFGAFTNVSYETPQQNKNVLGQMAYVLEGIKQLPALPSFKLTACFDNEVLEGEFILGMVSNSNSIAGINTEKAYKAQLNDGLFEVLLVKKPKTLSEMSALATQFLNQQFENDMVRIFKTSKVDFHFDEEVKWTLDGEFGGAVYDVRIEVEKEAVELII